MRYKRTLERQPSLSECQRTITTADLVMDRLQRAANSSLQVGNERAPDNQPSNNCSKAGNICDQNCCWNPKPHVNRNLVLDMSCLPHNDEAARPIETIILLCVLETVV